MKRKMMVAMAVMAVMISSGTGAVLAGHGPDGHPGGPPPGMEFGPGGGEDRMAKILNLDESQQKQVKAIMDTEREQSRALFDKSHELRKQLMQAAEATTFDEAAVRTLATEQARIEIELTVSRAKVHSKINALLKPEQRELHKRLRP